MRMGDERQVVCMSLYDDGDGDDNIFFQEKKD